MRAYASSALEIPPTPTIGIFTLRYSSLQTCCARSRSGALVRRVLVAPDVHAHGSWLRRQRRQPARDDFRAGIVEAHPVDDRAVWNEPEQPRLRVPGLRARRDAADLDPPESQGKPRR